jgi:Domain of unknown function DUF222./HNH endonuclease.
LSAGYATAVAHAVRHLTDEQAAAAEPILLRLIDNGGTPDDVAAMGRIILDTIDPDGRSAREKAKTANQHLTIASDWGGMGRVTGLLDPELTTLLRTWLEPLAGKAGPDDERSRARRMADALHTRLSEGGQRTVMHVVCDADTLTGDSETPGRFSDGNPLLPEDARRMAGNALLKRALRDQDGIIRDFGRGRRLASANQRQALQVLYATCAVDGCDIPSHLAEIDHLISWESGGGTDLDNLVPLCPPHNKFKYRHPDRVRIRDNPDGTKIITILPPWRSVRATAWRSRNMHNRP